MAGRIAAIRRGYDITTTRAGAESSDLAAIGRFHHDDGATSNIRLIVGATSRRAGRGPFTLSWDFDGGLLEDGVLIWLVLTNKGWAHLRGTVFTRAGRRALPFRADLFSAHSVGHAGPDRIAVRIYATGTDPNIDSPILKVQGWIDGGGIRVGRGH